ncbi:MAG: septal ring lytic transglycosylase RlpA family protein [Burkholderiaceae bacterium]
MPWTLILRLAPVFCALLLVACGSAPKRGAYYENDGPPDRAPADLAGSADAVPRVEPLNPRVNRPYTALGRRYTPLTSDVPFRQKGTASWYGKQFHGNRTASGEIYDMFAMTAAHPTLPIPSYVRVFNPRNGRTVIVRVNDRGPFKHDRIIDLSYGAATKLGIAGAGTAEVEIERLTFAEIASGEWRRGSLAARSAADPATTVPAPPPASGPAVASNPAGWSVQVGAFSDLANAEDLAGRVVTVLGFSEGELAVDEREARVERDGTTFRVLVGALPDRASALALAHQLERLLGRAAFPFSR